MKKKQFNLSLLIRLGLLASGVLLLAIAAFLPVDLVVNKAISPAVRQQILDRGTPERITFLENQFSSSLVWFRSFAGVLGSWLLLLGALFPILMKWDGVRSVKSEEGSVKGGECFPQTSNFKLQTYFIPLLWATLTIILSLPIITKGFENEEQLIMDMLAKRGILATAACQNQAPRAAQPAYTMIESIVVRIFGDSEASARAPSVVLGALVMIPLFLIALRLGGMGLANIACFLTATNAFFLFYINYARGYAFSMTMYLAAIYMGLIILEKSTWRRWIIMSLFILIGVYAHMAMGVYMAFVCIVILCVYMWQGIRSQRSEVRRQRSEVSGQRSAVSGQRSEVRSQKSVVSGQRSEVRGQRSEVRGQRSEVGEPRSSFIVHRSLLVRPIMVWGTVVLTLAWLYSIGIPASLDYLSKFDLTSYYMAYHINLRFLNVMLTLLAGLRMIPIWNWFVLVTGLTGIVILFRKSWVTATCLVLPLLGGITIFYTKGLFVYPRYFIFFIPIVCLFFATPIASLTSLPFVQKKSVRYAVQIIAWILLIAVASLNLHRLYTMERCGFRTAIEDAQKAMKKGDRIAGVLDGKVTVEHYYPGSVSMFSAADFWRELNSTNPPEWVINVPYIEYDIPGGWDALKKKYDLYKAYPSWMDVDDDQDSTYLYRLKVAR